MYIEEFLKNNNIIHFPSVPAGSSNTVSEFYEKAICIPRNSETIKKWHHLLTRYMNDPEAIILSRLYESNKLNGIWNNRRGLLTRMADGFSYACASNDFARIIFTMAYCNFVPEYQDFKKMMTERKFSLSSCRGLTTVEREHAAFRVRQYHTRFYTQGWYLAHIVAFKKDEYLGYPGVDIRDIITLGEKKQWRSNGSYYVRELPNTLSEKQKKIAKAQFLRFVDPINYFLVPSRSNSSVANIGEKDEIVNFMKKKYFDTFGEDYKDFMRKALVNPRDIPQESCEMLGIKCIPVSFGNNVQQPPANVHEHGRNAERQNAQRNRNQFTNQEQARGLKAYLFDGLSFRRIEREVLLIESEDRGGGFIAQKMMRSFNLTKKNKGMFAGSSLNQALNRANGAPKAALEFIQANLGHV